MNMNFKPIPGKVVEITEDYDKILHNHDVKQLHELSLLTQLGPKMAGTRLTNAFFKSVGHVHNARWVTTASNLLVLYMQEEDPSEDLILMTKFIVNCYTPSLLNIKKTPHCTNGTKHVYEMLQLCRELLEDDHPEIFSVVTGCIENNGYYFHPENIILSMVTDPDEDIRNEGIQLIEKYRSQDEERKKVAVGPKKVRSFRKPQKIDFNAKNYHDVVDFSDFGMYDVCSPPILRDYSLEEIKNRKFSDGFKTVPSHR